MSRALISRGRSPKHLYEGSDLTLAQSSKLNQIFHHIEGLLG